MGGYLGNSRGWVKTFPGFVRPRVGVPVTWTANPKRDGQRPTSGRSTKDFEFVDNVTKIVGVHTFKMGYQGMLTERERCRGIATIGRL